MSDTTYDVVGIGNAILDVLANTNEAFLEERGLVKGSMMLIDAEQAGKLYSAMSDVVECSGGSAANTMVGLASLGGRAAYIGKLRDDEPGHAFQRDIRAAGVAFETPLATSGAPSGRCLVLVTDDAQRTMQTFLGAAADLSPTDVDAKVIEQAEITYLEGYLWDPPEAKAAFRRAAEIAHAAGRKVALSLSDSFCVDRHRAEFLELIKEQVDILFGNEDEIVSLFQADNFESAVKSVQEICSIAALTRGAEGSVVVHDGQLTRVPCSPVERVLDTTGAGDLYASGFLFGLTRGQDMAACARLGGIAAAEIISHYGARPEASLKELVASTDSVG
jgi:sugar/nucleoside kinase (ribokinase family)